MNQIVIYEVSLRDELLMEQPTRQPEMAVENFQPGATNCLGNHSFTAATPDTFARKLARSWL